ncbi:hypothetical protein E3T34_09160 [Cryobacterium sp. TMT1-62]|nr:hypothetical protein E3O54_05280 [Cryobacterium sp. TMT2-4]TFD32113.1 hypothetical protein E3T34_09160 [Cryobacterium sp. TMT1-62]
MEAPDDHPHRNRAVPPDRQLGDVTRDPARTARRACDPGGAPALLRHLTGRVGGGERHHDRPLHRRTRRGHHGCERGHQRALAVRGRRRAVPWRHRRDERGRHGRALHPRREEIRRVSAADEKLLMDYFTTYSARFTERVDATLAVHGRAVIFDVHSYPEAELSDELHGGGYRAPLCVGSEPFHASVDLLATVGGCFPDLDAHANAPFAGSYVPLKHYRSDARVSSVMLEIRRDVYLDEATVTRKPEGFAPLQVSLKRLVDQVRYG